MQKSCSLQDFMEELNPWLDRDHIRKVQVDRDGRLVLFFFDGMRHVYDITDCNRSQINEVLDGLQEKGIVGNS